MIYLGEITCGSEMLPQVEGWGQKMHARPWEETSQRFPGHRNGAASSILYLDLFPSAFSSFSLVSLYRRYLKLNKALIQFSPHCLLTSRFPPTNCHLVFLHILNIYQKKVHQKPVLPQIYQSIFLFSRLLKEFKNVGCKHIYLKFALPMIITARCSYLTKPA